MSYFLVGSGSFEPWYALHGGLIFVNTLMLFVSGFASNVNTSNIPRWFKIAAWVSFGMWFYSTIMPMMHGSLILILSVYAPTSATIIYFMCAILCWFAFYIALCKSGDTLDFILGYKDMFG